MKSLVVLVICCILYKADAQYCKGEVYRNILKNCAHENAVTEVDVADWLEKRNAASENAKCFRACGMMKCRGMDEAGNINPVYYKEVGQYFAKGDFHKRVAITSSLTNCIKTAPKSGNACTIAEEFTKCVYTTCEDCDWTIFLNVRE